MPITSLATIIYSIRATLALVIAALWCGQPLKRYAKSFDNGHHVIQLLVRRSAPTERLTIEPIDKTRESVRMRLSNFPGYLHVMLLPSPQSTVQRAVHIVRSRI